MLRQFLILFTLVPLIGTTQKLKKDERQLVHNLQIHITFLASDKLQGRRTGTAGEKLAAEYISDQFKKAGLKPKGSQGYYQPFDLSDGKEIHPSTHVIIDGKTLKLHEDFYPLPFSGNGSLEALAVISLHEAGTPWFIDVKELEEANKANPHYNLKEGIRMKSEDLAKKGATAVIVYHSAPSQAIPFDTRENSETLSVPVLYFTGTAVKKYLTDETATLDLKIRTQLDPKKRTGTNVAGYIDNGATSTVIIGAHYDHLGFGEDGNSLFRSATNEIHNGADDNASGTAALIELARLLQSSRVKNQNFLFIAFSGEELGLFGSKYFVEHPTVDLKSINYMVNMDMVGRLNDSNVVTVGGYGTSPSWGTIFSASGRNSVYAENLKFRYDSSGTGPSDHTSFYRKDIPVLFYFTGLHTDYHKPTDDFDKINYNGQMRLVKHIFSVIENASSLPGKMAFTKTREVQMGTSARFSVTMGIMPDYTFSGKGLRVDGVSENRPAQKAGLKTGDIITSLGEHKVTSVETYMQALSKYKKGDKAIVSYSRQGQPLSSTVEF